MYSNGFFALWTDVMCLFKWGLCTNLASHISHWKGFFLHEPMLCVWFNKVFSANLASQILHWNGFFPSYVFSKLFKEILNTYLNHILAGFPPHDLIILFHSLEDFEKFINKQRSLSNDTLVMLAFHFLVYYFLLLENFTKEQEMLYIFKGAQCQFNLIQCI